MLAHLQLHKILNTIMQSKIVKSKKFLNNIPINALTLIGNKLYPRVQTQWKKEIFPPNNYAFIAMIAEPNQMREKTVPKIIVETVAEDANERIQERDMQSTRGPQRSQFFNFLPLPKGIITSLILLRICFRSLIRETTTGSSRVLSLFL